jgi:AraC-like DNA-binding protein
MKSLLLKVPTEPDYSFSIRKDKLPYVNNRLHYHPEVELIHFKNGEGTQFVGDGVSRFKSGDIILIGPNLPHFWRFDDKYFKEKRSPADVRVAHFRENFWGERFLNLPENKLIKLTLEKARRGIQLTGRLKYEVAKLIENALFSEGSRRIILLIEILTCISKCEHKVLSSVGFSHSCRGMDADDDRINKIYEYSLSNFREKISLKEIAEVANMSENSFCRYFKSRTRKTFMQFLIEIRVGHACKLLIENKMNIKQIYYESGFNNVTSFHKYFKIITGKSPLMYQRQFLIA